MTVDSQLLGDVEPVDDLVGTAVLQQRPVHEPEQARPELREDEIAVAELLQHRLRDDPSLIGRLLVALAEVAVELGQQLGAGEPVPGDPVASFLHPPGDPAQQLALVLLVD